jgi:hypothetical protein
MGDTNLRHKPPESEGLYVVLRGGSLVGNSYWSSRSATWPFATLAVSGDDLILTTKGVVTRSCYTFPRESIRNLVLRQRNFLGLQTASLQIVHSVTGAHPYVCFDTFNGENLARSLESAGYPIQRE